MRQHARVAIIGAGFAGAAAAYHLTLAGERDVVILESEPTPGAHSSGRNAAMARQLVADPHLARLAREGTRFLREGAPALNEGQPILNRTGSLLLCDQALAERLLASRGDDVEAACLPIPDLVPRYPFLEGSDCEAGLWCPSDGVVDIHALLSGYVRASQAAGASLLTSCRVEAIAARNGGFALTTTQGPISAELLVNAAGAWANPLARLAGADALPLRPCRRHLVCTPPMREVDPSWPFIWDVAHEVYFRPESGGLLLSACDEDEMAACLPPTNHAVLDLLGEKLAAHFPRLPRIEVQRIWAGLRTLTPDGRFVIGWDPRLPGFFWLAGLGGHGVTTSYAVGRLAADLLLGQPREDAAAFDPARLA
ncbi:MAG: FAD-binding oxidoreductase [Candidatus Tectomicrobia bacterium]|nr:FAD-binding oxidoreductase [Candidatus Tectomicrobia bacterium]